MLIMNKAQLFIMWLDGQLDGVTECDTERTTRIKEKLESIFEKHADDPSKSSGEPGDTIGTGLASGTPYKVEITPTDYDYPFTEPGSMYNC